MGMLKPSDLHRVPKGWGYEIWIANNDKYCGKLLHINDGKKCSWHFHKLKEEHFYVASGTIRIQYAWDDDRSKAFCHTLQPGDAFHVPIGLRHQMTAMDGDAEMYEFSTQHFDSDSHRVEKGD